MRRRARTLWLGSAVAWLACHASVAHAQPMTIGVSRDASVDSLYGAGEPLSSRLGLAVGRSRIYFTDPADRLRAVERLAALASPEAIEALLEAMEAGSPLARDPLGRLAVVRALAPYADRAEVRTFLMREMMDAGARRDVTSGLAALVRDTAALALARKGDLDSVKALMTAAALRGPAGDAARAAMVAAPPRRLEQLLFEDEIPLPDDDGDDEDAAGSKADKPSSAKTDAAKKKDAKDKGGDKDKGSDKDKGKGGAAATPKERTPRTLTSPVIQFLGELGDLRAVRALREELDRADRPTRAAAALALAKLGDASVAKVVKPWLEEQDPRFALAGAEVLVVLGDAGAGEALKALLGKEMVRSQAIRLAYELASEATVEPLDKLVPTLEAADQIRAIMALGRAGAASKLVPYLTHEQIGPAAVAALASAPSKAAREKIEEGLSSASAPTRRAFVRAAVLRVLSQGDAASGLTGALTTLASSKDPADLELASLGRVALGSSSLADVLAEAKGKAEPLALAIFAGAARGAVARPKEDLSVLVHELDGADAGALEPKQIAAGMALLSSDAADQLSFLTLLQLAEAGGALAPLAARALPRRADDSMKGRLLALLEGTDPSVRVGLALGLAESAHKPAVTWLASAYAREEDVYVRRALVASLAVRSETQREAPLKLARDLDPDAEVRAIAAAGLASEPLPASIAQGGVDPSLAALFAVVGADGSKEARALRLVLPSGMAVPMVTSTDGALFVVGVPYGRGSLELERSAGDEK